MPQKILVIAPKYSTFADDPYLTNDLVNELVRQKFHVTVVALGQKNLTSEDKFLSEKIIGISSKIKYFKYVFTWCGLTVKILKLVIAKEQFHRVLMFAPLMVMWPSAILIKILNSKGNIVFIFDIFPIHQIKIGALPEWTGGILKKLEAHFLRLFDTVIAMGIANKTYIKKYYFKDNIVPRVLEINLWSSSVNENKSIDYVEGSVKIIFGGQIIKGRRPEVLIDFVERLNFHNANLTLDIYSSGHEFNQLKKAYAHLPWLKFLDPVSRDVYTKLLGEYHVGSLVTDSSSDLPTFPSKIIDYISAGLYVFGIVEQESDLFSVFQQFSRVHLNAFDESENAINNALLFFKNVKDGSFANEVFPLKNIFDVKRAVEKILN